MLAVEVLAVDVPGSVVVLGSVVLCSVGNLDVFDGEAVCGLENKILKRMEYKIFNYNKHLIETHY